MPSIVFLDVDADDAPLVARRYPDAHVLRDILDPKSLINACKDAEIVSTFIRMPFTKEIIGGLPALKLLCTRSVGYDHIDLDACTKRGITVCNVPDYGSHVIAEHVFALLLSTLRHIPEGGERVQSGTFDYHGLRGMALRGKTIGIVGTGKIGRKVAQIAHGFGMKILASDQCRTIELMDLLGVTYVPLPELLASGDIITLHVPDLPDTRHMMNAAAFSRMKDGAILVNTARGSLIDSKALLSALQSGKVRYALLDVLEHEHNLEEERDLIDHPHVVMTPHVAFYADDSMRAMFEDSFTSIDQWLKGEKPEHAVKPLTVVCDLPPLHKQ